MKAFLSGFWKGFKQTFFMVGALSSFMLLMYAIFTIGEWVFNTYGVLPTMIVAGFFFMIGVGIVQGIWVLKHYLRLKRELEDIQHEYEDGAMNEEDYFYYKGKKKLQMEKLLSGNYDEVCR